MVLWYKIVSLGDGGVSVVWEGGPLKTNGRENKGVEVGHWEAEGPSGVGIL